MIHTNIFYIEGFTIDLSRSVIIKEGLESKVEPKVLSVLFVLAQRQNSVVKHQELMDEVWQGAEVVPNALQRCIAILRKELGDSAKSPAVIATHPRIGYRLIAEVTWHQDSLNQQADPNETSKKGSTSATKWFLLACLFLLLLIVRHYHTVNEQESRLAYNQIVPVTHTDAHESNAIYSPTGEFIVFNRYAGDCKSHLWAKRVETGQEYRLTQKAGDYSFLSFTGNGRELVFAARLICDHTAVAEELPKQDSVCWSIATLDFSLALSQPQAASYRHQCDADDISNPQSLSNHQYVFLEHKDQRWQLMRYNALNKSLSLFYESASEFIYHYDYDINTKKFAIFSQDSKLNQTITLLDDEGNITAKNTIVREELVDVNQILKGNFSSDGKYLLAVSHKKLYRIKLDGNLALIQTPANNLVSAVEHPINDVLLAVQGNKDVDIAQISLLTNKEVDKPIDLNSVTLPYESLNRTKAQERYAKYQPNGDAIAFISDRNGYDQIWLWDRGGLSLLSQDMPEHSIRSYGWSPDGNYISWVKNGRLMVNDLQGMQREYITKRPLLAVLDWFGREELLVLANDAKPNGLYLLNLKTNTLEPYGINFVDSAWVVNDILLYSDLKGKVYSQSLTSYQDQNKEPQHLASLNGQAMFVQDGLIYSVDLLDYSLNQYGLDGKLLKKAQQLKPTAWKVSDSEGDNLLLTQFIGISQDIAELNH